MLNGDDDGEAGSASSGAPDLLPSSSPLLWLSSVASWGDGANATAVERRVMARIVGNIVAGRRRCSPTTAGPTWIVVALAGILAFVVTVEMQFRI